MTEFEQTKELAEQGYADAQTHMGNMYYDGRGVKQDYAEALRWYTKAAEQGDADAQNNLGFMYQKGRGVKQDYAVAIRWYSKAAEQGNDYARIWLYRLTPPAQKAQKKLDFTNRSRLDLLSSLAKEINDVVLAYDGSITLAEAIGVLEIAKIELYNNQSAGNKR